MESYLTRRQVLMGIPLLVASSALPSLALARQEGLGIIGSKQLSTAKVADCVWIKEQIKTQTLRLQQFERMTPIWFSEQLVSLQSNFAAQEKKLIRNLKEAKTQRTLNSIGAVGEFIAFAAGAVALVATSPVVIGAALGVVLLAGPVTFLIQAALEKPNQDSALEFISFHANGRAGFIIGSSSKRLFQNLGIGMAALAAAYASGKAYTSIQEVNRLEGVVDVLRSDVKKMTTDHDFAVEMVRQSVLDNIRLFESMGRFNECKPILIPVPLEREIKIHLG